MSKLVKILFPNANPKSRRDIMDFIKLPRQLIEIRRNEQQEDANDLSNAQLNDLKELFRMYDKDNSGTIDLKELTHALKAGSLGGLEISSEEVEHLMRSFDSDDNAVLDESEFILMFKDVL